jgi:8-oxo-dGTP pyrophosphatase MutT (NUDIX family)
VIVVYAHEPFPEEVTRMIFLDGPTPREQAVASWRPEALRLLAERGYDGHVFVPEARDGLMRHSYDDQVEWELEGLRRADAILFWIPRHLETMPAFTTNVELGMWHRSGRVVLGAPEDAPKLRYLRFVAEKARVPLSTSLARTIDHALAIVGDGAPRRGAECVIPAAIFTTPSFQAWHRAQRDAGNVLHDARVEWVFRAGQRAGHAIVYWALHVDVLVTKEQRHKRNEVVIARPDIAVVVLHHGDEIALIREFRSAGATPDGWVRENPGGSSFTNQHDLLAVAVEEVHEEIGLTIAADRLRLVGVRQLMATMSAHRAHVWAVELTAEEIAKLRALAGVVHGADDNERTTIEIWRVGDLLATPEIVDWSTLGMIFAARRA